jgi:cysteine desulfurase
VLIPFFKPVSFCNHTFQEHKCVLDSCRKLGEEGFEVTYLPVQQNGVISLESLEAAIRPDTSLVSIMAVNNETGVIQPLKEIGAILRKHRGIYFHTDAAQAVGKIPIDVNEMNIDLLSISGHKLYGPKGIGAAYVRRRPRVRLEPILSGGGQERGLRSGTLAPALVVGLGEAARIAKNEMEVSLQLRCKICDERCTEGAEWWRGILNMLFKSCQLSCDNRAGVLIYITGLTTIIPWYQLSNLAFSQRDYAHVQELSNRLLQKINSQVEHVVRNGDVKGYPGCVNLSFAYVEGESLLMALKVHISFTFLG